MSLIDEIVRASRENLDKEMTKPGSSKEKKQDITEWLINAASNMYSSAQDRYKEALKEESKRNDSDEIYKDPDYAPDEIYKESATIYEANDYDIDEMAGEVILGAWGNGQDRIDNMLNAGFSLDDYNKIQQRVNEAYASGRDLHEWTNKANEKLRYW